MTLDILRTLKNNLFITMITLRMRKILQKQKDLILCFCFYNSTKFLIILAYTKKGDLYGKNKTGTRNKIYM